MRFLRIFVPVLNLLFLALLFGCGGEGKIVDEPAPVTSGGDATGTGSITLSLTKLSDNNPTTSVSVDSPAKLTATARGSNGSPLAGKVIAFSSISDLSFNPASGTALTDANGTASITVRAGNTTGATTINAETADTSGAVISKPISLSVVPRT